MHKACGIVRCSAGRALRYFWTLGLEKFYRQRHQDTAARAFSCRPVTSYGQGRWADMAELCPLVIAIRIRYPEL